MLTIVIKVFILLLTTNFNYRTPHVLPQAQVDISLTLNYHLTRLIIRIDVDLAGVVEAISDEGVVRSEHII